MYKLERWIRNYEGGEKVEWSNTFSTKEDALKHLQGELNEDRQGVLYYHYKLFELKEWTQIPYNIKVTA